MNAPIACFYADDFTGASDNLAQFHRWERWQDIANLMPIAVYARPGSTFRDHAPGVMHAQEDCTAEISSGAVPVLVKT